MLWFIVALLLVLWLVGYPVLHLGNLIHFVLVVAVIVVLYELFVNRRRL